MNSWATWWVRPSTLLLFFIFPLYVLLYHLPETAAFSTVSLKTLVYFNRQMFVYGLLLLVALYMGCLVPLTPKVQRKISQEEIDLVLDILGVLTILGYLYMLLPLFSNPGMLLDLFNDGLASIDRGSAGISSLQQLGLCYFTVFCFTWSTRGFGAIQRRQRIVFAIIVGLVLFRGLFIAQRLALIEAGVPFALFFVLSRIRKAGPLETAAIGLFPIVSLVLLVILFATTEYLRSWVYHRDEGGQFWDYMIGRLATYYYTALNNGSLSLQTSDWPTYAMTSTLGWLYRLPGISDILVAMIGPKFYRMENILELYADPEFNNPSGLFPIIHDLGVPGAVMLYFLVGVWLSYCYRCFIIATSWSAFYYPLIFLTVVEILRIVYLGSSKLIVQVVLFWIISLVVRSIIDRRNIRRARKERAQRAIAAGVPAHAAAMGQGRRR